MLIDKLLKKVEALKLNLKGKVVLTEAATGAYVVTPILAALAGARVFAYSRTTSYGTVEEVFAQSKKVFQSYEGPMPDIEFIDTLTPEIISQADIITNSGHLRPLNKEKLQHAKEGVVIPLMYEAWEMRNADIDLPYIKERGIKIGATNERHPDVDVFNYLGDMAVKQILDAGMSLYNNKFILVCNNEFGPYIAKVVAKMCHSLAVVDKAENRHQYPSGNIEWISDFPEIKVPEKFRDAEAVIFTAYPFDKIWIGNQAVISVKALKENLANPLLLRYAGDVDTQSLDAATIPYFPAHVASGHMGILPSAVGYDPIIGLQAGGLKVGEALLSGKYQHKGVAILELL